MQTTKMLKSLSIGYIVVTIGFVLYWTTQKSQQNDSEVAFTNEINSTPVAEKQVGLRDSIVAFGMDYLGTPYVTAGCSKDGFDCSGFVYYVFNHFDIDVPRSSASFEHFGTEIPIESVEKGDLLLFLSPTRNAIGHVGIVSTPKGKESDFIHASSGKEMQVIITPLSNAGYTKRFVKALRVIE